MQTVTPGASHLEVTPIAYGTWQFGGDWESVDEQAALSAPSSARRSAPTRPTRMSRPCNPRWLRPSVSATSKKSPDESSNGHPNCP
jgi:hypothetical protein